MSFFVHTTFPTFPDTWTSSKHRKSRSSERRFLTHFMEL